MPEKSVYTLEDFDFGLPEELIAQYPEERREESRLFVLHRRERLFEDRRFFEIVEYLRRGDVLVFNDTKVIPARISLKRATGGKAEMVLARRIDETRWLALCSRTRRIKTGDRLVSAVDPSVTVVVIARREDCLEIASDPVLDEEVLKRIGEVPLPPYIRRPFTRLDEERYQTVYARRSGAAAAPTAGLHFSPSLLRSIDDMGVESVALTLFVSWGTFQPVREMDITRHRMHKEEYQLAEESALRLNTARREGRRIIAVGTTALRVLETTFRRGENIPGAGETDLFIYPPRRIASADALITNFHTPRSTLLMLVAAFAGYDLIMEAYQAAVRNRYRFFSYGDAMVVL